MQWWPARQAAKAPLYKASTRTMRVHSIFSSFDDLISVHPTTIGLFQLAMNLLSLENILHCY